jgi:zinc protease
LAEENRVVLISAPEKAGVTVPGEAELRRLLAAVEAAPVDPYQDLVVDQPLVDPLPTPVEIVEERRHDSVAMVEWRLANGVRVLVKATDFRDDEVVLNAFAPGGLSRAADADVVSASFAADLARVSGVGAFSLVELQRALTGKAASVTPFISELEQGFSGQASPSDLETLFQLVYLHFTAPRLDPGAAAALTQRLRAALNNRSADPNAAFADTLQATLSQHHPRYPPPTMAMLAALDPERALAFYRDRFSDAAGFTFVLVGNLDLATLRPLVQRYLGGLPSTRRGESWRDTGVRPPVGVVERVVRQGLEPRSHTQLVFTGAMPYTRENRYALRALSDVLEIRLHEVLREDLGGTYGVQVVGNALSKPEASYQLNIAFGAAPEQLDPLVAALFQELERLETEGPSEGDLERVREIQRRERETSLRQNGYWLGQISGYAREGLDYADIMRYEQLVEGLTADLIRQAARTLLRTDNYVRVSLFPAR